MLSGIEERDRERERERVFYFISTSARPARASNFEPDMYWSSCWSRSSLVTGVFFRLLLLDADGVAFVAAPRRFAAAGGATLRPAAVFFLAGDFFSGVFSCFCFVFLF